MCKNILRERETYKYKNLYIYMYIYSLIRYIERDRYIT